MNKIRVVAEGREGVWLAEKESVVGFLKNYKEEIHHMNTALKGIIIGADWDRGSVIENVEKANKVAIMTGEAFKHNMRHALAVVSDELDIFDIGDVTKEQLEIVNEI